MFKKNYDAIIIGAGLGGLVTGVKLSKAGKKVLVIEQNNRPGGCAISFKRKNIIFEAALHEIDGFAEGEVKYEFFKELGIYEYIKFVKIPEFYRFVNGDIDIVIPYNTEEIIQKLLKHFPAEEKGLRKFFGTILKLRNEINRLPKQKWKIFLGGAFFPFRYPNIFFNLFNNVGHFVDKLIKDDELKMILLATISYYADDPYSLSMIYYAIAQGSLLELGGYYIKGGAQQLSNFLAKVIKENNGEIMLNTEAVKIITNGKKAIGVEFRKNKSSETKIEYTDTIIANAAIPVVLNKLLPDVKIKKFRKKISSFKNSISLFSIYLYFKKPLSSLGNKYYSTIVFHRDMSNIMQIKNNARDNKYKNKNFIFVDYSSIDSGLTGKDEGFGNISLIDSIENWINLSVEEYKKKKKKVAEILLERLEEIFPGINNIIEYYEVSTPMTIKRYISTPGGNIYGFSQLPSQAGLNTIDHISPVKNLYFASAWTMPGGGFTGAIMSGILCSEKILKNLSGTYG